MSQRPGPTRDTRKDRDMRHAERSTKQFAQHQRRGFTLTEMLVAVGLLLVIMTIFAQIFQLAVSAMTNQKGLANNDTRARTAFAVLDADLKRMSYRSIKGQGGIVPLVPGLMYNGRFAADEQRGYFYYSENDPNDDSDDVLQFTVDATLTQQYSGARRYANQTQLPYFGRAAALDMSGRRDQPDWDDGNYGDGVSMSRWAEVSYFLRHGTLYRRVMLIRDTDDGIPGNMARFDDGDTRKLAQPGFPVGPPEDRIPIDMMRPDAPNPYGGNFYTDFDFSAHHGRSPYDDDLPPGSPEHFVAVFHGSLSNEPENNWPLGVPHFRFGFNPMSGRPREFVTDGDIQGFIGRFTHEETSNATFQYPQQMGTGVFTRTDFNMNALYETGRLDVFANGPRRGGDILLTNVHSFNVEIWDANASGGVGGFVNINSGAAAYFSSAQKLNPTYASRSDATTNVHSNIFDTWHSIYDLQSSQPDFNRLGVALPTRIGNGQPPFVPKLIDPTSIPEWNGSTTYDVGNRVVPTNLFRNEPMNRYSRINGAIYYQCVSAGAPGATEPNWPADAGMRDDIPDGSVLWRVVDNRRPIKAIRITVRFLDPTSQQMRQMTLVHSFNENEVRIN